MIFSLSSLPSLGAIAKIERTSDGEQMVLPLRPAWRQSAISLIAASFFVGLGIYQTSDHSWLGFGLAGVMVSIFAVEVVFSVFGRETIQVGSGHFVHAWSALGLRRSRRYALREIESICPASTRFSDYEKPDPSLASPMGQFGNRGRVKIDLASKSIYVGAMLGDSEAEDLVKWLGPRLRL